MSILPSRTAAAATTNPCAAWYYPQFSLYGIFCVLAVTYTTCVHALFRSLIVKRPQIAQPVVKSKLLKQTSKDDDIRRRIAIVTGSNTGVGLQTAKMLVLKYDLNVILACRSEDKALAAMEEINSAAKGAGVNSRAIFVLCCDLSSFASVKQFAKAVKEQYDTLDILVNNAGLNRTARTNDGYDLVFQSCFLGHFLLTKLLFDLFPEDGSGRIINLSSVKHHFRTNWTGFVSLDEDFWRYSALDHHKKNHSYPNAKQAAIFFTLELNRRFYHVSSSNDDDKTTKRVRAFAANPGAVNSDIWRKSLLRLVRPILRLLFLNTEEGAATSVAAAVHDEFDESDYYLQPYWMPSSARYTAPFPVLEMMGPFVGFLVTQPRLPTSDVGVRMACEALWKVGEELTNCKFDGNSETAPSAVSQGASSTANTSLRSRSKVNDKSGTSRESRSALGLVTNTAPRKENK